MKADVKEKWLSALRSGQYKQGGQYLKREIDNEMRHCCLGVLCEIAQAEGVIEEGRSVGGVRRFGNEHTGLPVAVQEWAGVKGRMGRLDFGSSRSYLSDLNDNGLPFSTIAGIIEEKF